jgi:large subunit ribosomal protein L10
MALTRDEKTAQIADLTEKMKRSSSVMFAQYFGLKVSNIAALRRKLKAAKAEMQVAKKTLMAIAAKNAGLPAIEEKNLEGGVACIFSFDDPLSGAQVALAFSKENPQVSFVAGIFDGKVFSKQEALAFAKTPSRQQLLATFMGMIRSPLVNFASMCNSPLRNFAVGMSELAKKKATA